MKFSAELIDERFNHQSHRLICTTGKTMAFESYLPKRGFLKIPSQSEKNPLNPMGFTWFSYVFPTNFMAFRPRIPRLLQGARPHQGSRTETGSILVAGAGTMPLAASFCRGDMGGFNVNPGLINHGLLIRGVLLQ